MLENSSNKILERLGSLMSKGYEVRIRPDVINGCIEIRLTKNHWKVARIIDPSACRQSCAWNSDEEWFLYTLRNLEMQYEEYARRVLEGAI